jgi:SET domain-containing protein
MGKQSTTKPERNKSKYNWHTLTSYNNGVRISCSTIYGAGQGVFSCRNFYPGDAICEYGGRIVSRDRIKDPRYAIVLSKQYMLDGFRFPCEDKVNIGSMINDALDPFKTNCEILIVPDAWKFKYRTHNENTGSKKTIRAFIICVNKQICVGDELFLSYGERYWRQNQQTINELGFLL